MQRMPIIMHPDLPRKPCQLVGLIATPEGHPIYITGFVPGIPLDTS